MKRRKELIHKGLEKRWAELPFEAQMGNIGSEVSRALKWQQRGKQRYMDGAIDRALELMDLSIGATREHGKLKELCRAREEFTDYFFGGNSFKTEPKRMLAYYDQFALLARKDT